MTEERKKFEKRDCNVGEEFILRYRKYNVSFYAELS